MFVRDSHTISWLRMNVEGGKSTWFVWCNSLMQSSVDASCLRAERVDTSDIASWTGFSWWIRTSLFWPAVILLDSGTISGHGLLRVIVHWRLCWWTRFRFICRGFFGLIATVLAYRWILLNDANLLSEPTKFSDDLFLHQVEAHSQDSHAEKNIDRTKDQFWPGIRVVLALPGNLEDCLRWTHLRWITSLLTKSPNPIVAKTRAK